MNILTREEQRSKAAHNLLTSTQLWAHLTNLKQEILNGDATKLTEFQQFVQFAPPGMRLELLADY